MQTKFNPTALYKLRKKRKIDQTKFAEMVGVSRQTIWAWETADSTPKAEYIGIMCDILKITPNYLFTNNRSSVMGKADPLFDVDYDDDDEEYVTVSGELLVGDIESSSSLKMNIEGVVLRIPRGLIRAYEPVKNVQNIALFELEIPEFFAFENNLI